MLEFVLSKIGLAILKAAAVRVSWRIIGDVFGIKSIFRQLDSISDCPDLGIAGLEVGYGVVSSAIIDAIANLKLAENYEIQRRESGIYVAKTRLISKPLYLASYSEFPDLCPDGRVSASRQHVVEHRKMNIAKIEIRRDYRGIREDLPSESQGEKES